MSFKKPFYGWIIAGELAITETIAWGILYYAFSVLLTPMEQSLGWTREQLTGAFSLALLFSGITALPVGWWLDRHGARLLMTVGAVLGALLVLAWSAVQTVEAYYAVWVLIGIIMAMVLYDPAFVLIAKWFTRRRGAALALVTFAAGLASTIFLPLTDWLMQMHGWRGALVILAALLGVVLIPTHALILRRSPADLGLRPDGAPQPAVTDHHPQHSGVSVRVALADSTFWLLAIAFALALLASNSMRVHLIPFLIERDYDASFAAWIGAAIGVAQVIGRVAYVPLEARFSPRTLAIMILLLQACSFVLLLIGDSIVLLWSFVLIYGISLGTMTLVRPALTAGTYGAASFGRINSIMSFIMTLAITIGPFGASFVYERLGGYTLVLMLLIVLSLIAAGALMRVPRKALSLDM